jgi:hypothetical protein
MANPSNTTNPSDPQVLLALADRCEREGPSRKLDLAIAAALNGGRYIPYAKPYTTSLDAAVTLVPEGWRPTDLCWDSDMCRFGLFTTTGWRHAYGVAQTEPMARCAASLRARAAQPEGE